MNKFIILAAPRSGSNLLSSLLHSHSQVLCHHELYNPKGIFYALPLRESAFQLAQTVAERDADPFTFLARIWQQHLNHTWVGFKMTYRQNPDVLQNVLADSSIKKIILQRKNHIKSYVSKLIAERSGIWEDYKTVQPEVRCQVTVDRQALEQDITLNMTYYNELEQQLKQNGQQALHLSYESLMREQEQQRLLSYLHLPYEPLHTQSRKQTPLNLRAVIKNFDQLHTQIVGTTLEQQLLSQEN